MAGTRLAIQTMVIAQVLLVVVLSVHHGFCRANCKRGNLTKDFPLVPGLDHSSNSAIVQAQWWEDALCHPIASIANVLLGGSSNERTSPIPENTNGNARKSSDLSSAKLDMMLAVENATQLSQWIEILSTSLLEDESKTSFASVLSLNPMGLEIIPPLILDEDEPFSSSAIWSHYKKHSTKGKSSERQTQQRLVVYIPAWVSIREEAIGWKAFDVSSSSGEKSSTTMVLPKNIVPSEQEHPTVGRLQSLVEDWMARSILSQPKPEPGNEGPTATVRLTREFPFEHFLAVLMPLLFPLILPFLVSWIKEYKRYKGLTASKKNSAETTNTGVAGRTTSKQKVE